MSPDWHTAVGAGKEVQWPTGIGAQGNDGVAGGVKQTEGAAGYVELNYATQTSLTSAVIKNAAGKFVAGSTDGVTAAAEAAVADFPADFRQAPIINGAGDTTYPIASYTYLLIPVDWSDADKAQAMVSFTYWALTDGQAEETTLGYAPLPGRDPAEVDRRAPQGHDGWHARSGPSQPPPSSQTDPATRSGVGLPFRDAAARRRWRSADARGSAMTTIARPDGPPRPRPRRSSPTGCSAAGRASPRSRSSACSSPSA